MGFLRCREFKLEYFGEYIPGILSNNALGESCLKQFYGNIYTWKILCTTMATEPQEFQFCDRRNIYSSGLFVCSCFYAQNVTLKESFQPVISKEKFKTSIFSVHAK